MTTEDVNKITSRRRKKFYGVKMDIYVVLIALIIALDSVIEVCAKNSSFIEKNNCGGHFSGYQYTISSPNYPDNYPPYQDCTYILSGSRIAECDQVFHLQFLDFALTPSEDCSVDYLTIDDRSIYCGNVVGIRRFLGKNNSISLRFHSDEGKAGKGFKILVTTAACTASKSDKLEISNSTGKNITEKATAKFVDEKMNVKNDIHKDRFLENGISYPVYHPKLNSEVKDKNITSISLKSDVIKQSKISSYLFLPPELEKDTSKIDDSFKFSAANLSSDFLKKDVDNSIIPPATKILLPIRWSMGFREIGATNVTRKVGDPEENRRINQKFIVPARSYGVPEGSYYPLVNIPESEIKAGEVLENSRGIADCQGSPNLEPDLEVTSSFRGKTPTLIDNIDGLRGTSNNYYPGTIYGSPGPSYPTNIPVTNIENTPNSVYGSPVGNYPGSNGITGNGRPNNWLPSSNFLPSSNVPVNNNNGNSIIFPIPGIGSGSIFPGVVNPGTNGRYSECCNNVYSSQRFTLSSPGFPGFLYSANSYECVYAIKPFSSNICQMRFNFRFFNHGTEDRFCTYGYVEIDGQRICGCKKGLSIVSIVSSAFPKIIGVKYSGYPRTKFNGFVIEVIQEPCSNSYPYLSRRKKQVGNSTSEIIGSNYERTARIVNTSFHRIKRNLGYSYPKPNFGLTEEVGITQPWNSGNAINSGIHELFNVGGIGTNLFSPLAACQAFSFFDWTLAAKEVYLRGGRCVGNNNGGSGTVNPGYPGNGGTIPGYPGGGGSGTVNPGYPGNGGNIPEYPGGGGSGTVNPGYPGNGGNIPGYPGGGGSGTVNPGYPGNGGIIPGYPGGGGSGTINPGYPGNGGTIPGYPGGGGSGTVNPGYPGNGGIIPGYPGGGGSGTINPGYPGNGGTIPGYPGNGGSGTINPGYPGNGGTIPGYPGGGGSGTINPGYPGNGGTIPGYPGGGGSGTINPGYPGTGSWNFPSVKCDDVNVIEGIISSPQYPTNYPSNVNKCYRFYKAPESCQLELAILDFDLENSAGCTKDYVAFSGQNRRYCGKSLAGIKTLFDISRANIVDMYFVSDGFGSGRGFSVGFSQIPCRGLINR